MRTHTAHNAHAHTHKDTNLYTIYNIYRVFLLHWYPPKKLKYGKPWLGESMLTYIGLDTPNLA